MPIGLNEHNRVLISEDPIRFKGRDYNLFRMVENNPVRRRDPLGLWYTDINFSIEIYGGITVGAMLVDDGFYPYLGYGVMSPGLSVTTSSSDPSLGWNMGAQGAYGLAGQFGVVEDDIQSPVWFGELGLGTPGISVTRYYVFKKQSYAPPLAKCH